GRTIPGPAGPIGGRGLPNLDQVPQVGPGSAAGGAARVIGYGRGPRWSPDGSRLAYGTTRGIEVGTTDGTRLTSHRVVVPAGRDHQLWQATWSPRGRYLAYADNAGASSEIHVVRVSDG